MIESTLTTLIKASPQALAKLTHDGLINVFEFSRAPQGVKPPYVVWQLIGGEPANTLSCRPDSDQFMVQFDAYATTSSEARDVAMLVTDAIELECYVTRWGGETRDYETKLFRCSFDTDWIQARL